ncbi:MAG: zinc ribbon domain-containing protein, partial [Pyrinomonadaceae bacterium]
MNYCPECGSEVAPENTFCAYCGMAMTPIVPEITEIIDADQADLSAPANEAANADKVGEEAGSNSSSQSVSDSESVEDLPQTFNADDSSKIPEEISTPAGESVSGGNIREEISG